MPPPRASHLLLALSLSVILILFHRDSNPNLSEQTRLRDGRLHSRQASSNCGYRGNPDLYGFGIRLGLYLQWIASVFSKAWTPSLDSLRYLFDADAIFLLAIFIATSVYSAGVLEPVHDIDILILLHMFFGDVYCVFFELAFQTERRDMPISAWGVRYRALVIGGMSAYAVWFWFIGLGRLPAAPCGSNAFLFAKIALRGRVQIFFKVVAIANLLVWGMFALASLVAFFFDPYSEFVKAQATRKTRYFRFNYDHSDRDPRRVLGLALSSFTWAHSSRHNMAFQTPEFWRILKADYPYVWKIWKSVVTAHGVHSQYKGKTRYENRWRQFYLYANVLIALFSIVAIETIIRWNDISDAYSLGSTSQIIPLVIGIGNFWNVIVSLLNEVVNESAWNPNHHVFRLRDGRWKSFPIHKPERRLSSFESTSTEMEDNKASVLEALEEDYKEWLVPTKTSAEKSRSGDSFTGPVQERLGISSLRVFLLSLSSNSRLPSDVDLSQLVANLHTFARSKRLTVLGVMTAFASEEGNGEIVRELLLWPMTSQAASKMAAFRKVDDDWDFAWKFQSWTLYRSKLGLEGWEDFKYDPAHIIDRRNPLKKARMTISSAYSEENFAEENTWRRVWSLKRASTDREGLAKCLMEILKDTSVQREAS